MKLPRFSRTFAGLALVALIGAGAAACGGDDKKADSTSTSAASTTAVSISGVPDARAEAVAHSALLTDKDLDGKGWDATEFDKFDDNAPTPPGAACAAIAKARAAVKAQEAAGRSARAKVQYSRDSTAGIPTEVEHSVNVFKDLAALEASWSALKVATGGTNVQDCFTEALTEQTKGTGATVTATKATLLGTPPAGGFGVAADVKVVIKTETLNLHLETHYWRTANVGSSLTFTGSKGDVTATLVTGALRAAEAHLKAAAK